MAKKKKNRQQLWIIIAALAVLSVLFIFAPALSGEDYVLNGTDIVFGKEVADYYVAGARLDFSVLALLAYLFPLGGMVLILFRNKTFTAISALLLIAGAVLLFLMPIYTKMYITLLGNVSVADITWSMQWGLIVSGSASGLAALASLYNVYMNK